MEKPLIGVMPLWDNSLKSVWMLPEYLKSIEDAGGMPVVLPLTSDPDMCVILSEKMDGFLFTGGQDISPKLYGEEAIFGCDVCEERDSMEIEIFREAVIRLNKPSLGICRGLQFFNVVLGGTLYQDLSQKTDNIGVIHKQKPPYDRPIHCVRIIRDKFLFSVLEQNIILVNSYHHQGIKDLSDELECVAKSDDGLVEAAYMPKREYVVAVQWHPENTMKDVNSMRLFSSFVRACQKNSN